MAKYVTIVFPPGNSFRNDQWKVDGWTYMDVCDDVCELLDLPGWKLQKDGVDVVGTDEPSDGETLTMVEA